MSLKEMTDTSRLQDDEPMPAVMAVHQLYELGMDDEAVRVNYPKLAGRPVGGVLAFLANLEGRAPESWQYHITEFCKTTWQVYRFHGLRIQDPRGSNIGLSGRAADGHLHPECHRHEV